MTCERCNRKLNLSNELDILIIVDSPIYNRRKKIEKNICQNCLSKLEDFLEKGEEEWQIVIIVSMSPYHLIQIEN